MDDPKALCYSPHPRRFTSSFILVLQAFSVMEEMRRRVPNINMAYYVNMKTIEATHKAVGAPLGRGMGAERDIRGELDEDEGEEVEEEVEEEMVNGHDDY